MKATVGGHINFQYEGKKLAGVVLQSEKDCLVIKLSSGYNLSVKANALKDVKAVKVAAKEKKMVKKRMVDKSLPRIAILHTGGTIASRIDYETGAVVAKFTNEELLEMFPELERVGRIESTLISNMQSDDMRFNHWNTIADAVAQAVKEGVQGVIVTHGTDTMGYTAAALGFALEGLPVPVVLVGSQRSSDRGSSDAPSNLLAAARFINAAARHPGVYTCMHASSSDDSCTVIDAFHSRKLHSTRRDAFKAVNTRVYATVKGEKVNVHGKPFAKSAKQLSVKPFNPKLRVGILYVHPHLYAKDVEAYKDVDGLIVMATGLGHVPITKVDAACTEHEKIYDAIATLAKKVPVVVTTQTLYGRVNLNVYSPGRKLQRAGVLGHGLDLIPETAFVKLAWLLSNYDKKETRSLYAQNLRGEWNERSTEDTFNPE